MTAINDTSLDKTDLQNFSQKFLLTLRMIRDFINAWLNLLELLPNFSWSQYRVDMNGKTVNASRVFVLNSEGDFAHTSTTFLSLADSNMELGNRKRFSVPNFKLNNYLHQKHFCFKKSWRWDFLFLILTHFEKKHISFKFGISQFANDSSKENFLVYALVPLTKCLEITTYAETAYA